MEFKDVLKQLRQSRGYSQVRLAELLDVSSGLIGMYEIGKRKPSYEQLESMADFFNVSTDYLIGKENRSTYYLDPAVAEIAASLSSEEVAIINAFRSADEIDRESVRRTLGVSGKNSEFSEVSA